MGQVETRGLDQLALGADALEEQHELQLEEDHGVDPRAATFRIGVLDPVPDEAEIELGFQVPVEVVSGD